MVLVALFISGHLHVPVYGLCAAAGLLAALWLSQRTAPMAGLPPEKLTDAGVCAIAWAFVASRTLLIAQSPQAFVHYPLIMLALPSFTYGAMVLTVFLTVLYLRWKRLPLLDTLDAWAPCLTVLAAALQIGHSLEGTDFGMPTRLPWGMVERSSLTLGPTQPVGLYAAAFALVLGGFLWSRLSRRTQPGQVAASGLIAAGVGMFLLDMVRQPDTTPTLLLDRSQWAAIVVMAAGAILAALAAKPHPLLRTPVLSSPDDVVFFPAASAELNPEESR